MRWTERQRAMLAEMGLRPWFRDDGELAVAEGSPDVAADASGAAVAAKPDSDRARLPAAAPSVAPPPIVRVDAAPSSLQPSGAPAHAGWLIVGGPPEVVAEASRAAVEAEQDTLLANMLRAIGVSLAADDPAARPVQVRAGAPEMDDLDRLHAQVQPRCVLALGRAAATALLGIDEPLGRLRGRAHAWHGVPVVVTFPLAYLLRNPGEKAKAWLDLCLAAAAADAPAAP